MEQLRLGKLSPRHEGAEAGPQGRETKHAQLWHLQCPLFLSAALISDLEGVLEVDPSSHFIAEKTEIQRREETNRVTELPLVEPAQKSLQMLLLVFIEHLPCTTG